MRTTWLHLRNCKKKINAPHSLAKHLALVAHQPQLEPLIHDEQLVRAEHANSTTPVTEGFVSNGISSAIKQHFEPKKSKKNKEKNSIFFFLIFR